eukprot:g2825.t1
MANWVQIQTAASDTAPSARSSHQLSALGSCLYLFGGEYGPECSHFGYGLPVTPMVHTLDLGSLSSPPEWQVVPIYAGSPPSARLGHGQCIVEVNGRGYLYVFGGRQPAHEDAVYDGNEEVASLNDMHRLDISAGIWEELKCNGDIPSERSYVGMTLHRGVVYLFGGMIDNDRYNDLHSFDPSNNQWERLPNGPMEGRGGGWFLCRPQRQQ